MFNRLSRCTQRQVMSSPPACSSTSVFIVRGINAGEQIWQNGAGQHYTRSGGPHLTCCQNWCTGATHVGGDNGAAGPSWPVKMVNGSLVLWSMGLWCSGARVSESDSIAPQSDCAHHSPLIARNPSTPGGKLKRQIAKLDQQQLHSDCSISNVDVVLQF